MMIGSMPTGPDFQPGTRFLAGRSRYDRTMTGRRDVPELLLEVISNDGEVIVAKDHLGCDHAMRSVWNMPPQMEGDLRVQWLFGLPRGGIEEIMAVAEAIMQRDERYRDNRTLLLHASGDTSSDRIPARVVIPFEGSRTGWHGHEDVPGEVRPTCFIPSTMVMIEPDVLEGIDLPALVAVNAFQTKDVDGPIIVKGAVSRIASLPDLDAVEAWMPEPVEGRSSGLARAIGGMAEIEYEISRAHAKTEKDEILVVMTDSTDGSGTSGHVLSKTGIRLHDVDELSDHLWSLGLEQGIWIGTEVSWSDCGEDGWEWDARWSKATAKDLERHGIDLDEVVDHASDMAERRIGREEAAGWLAPPAAVTA